MPGSPDFAIFVMTDLDRWSASDCLALAHARGVIIVLCKVRSISGLVKSVSPRKISSMTGGHIQEILYWRLVGPTYLMYTGRTLQIWILVYVTQTWWSWKMHIANLLLHHCEETGINTEVSMISLMSHLALHLRQEVYPVQMKKEITNNYTKRPKKNQQNLIHYWLRTEGFATGLKSRTLELKSYWKSWNLTWNPEILLEILKSI